LPSHLKSQTTFRKSSQGHNKYFTTLYSCCFKPFRPINVLSVTLETVTEMGTDLWALNPLCLSYFKQNWNCPTTFNQSLPYAI